MATVAELQSFSSVPKLETNGSNWIIFQIRLKWALEEKRVFKHLDGTSTKPADNESTEKKEEWISNETKARHLLAQKLYDSTLTKLLHHATVSEMWTAITQEFTVKSSHVVAAMRASFDSFKCADNGNIRTHLDKLRLKYEELIGIGITISPTDYATRIIGSLPPHYQRHLSTIEASARASALATTAVNATATGTSATLTTPKQTFSISPDLLVQLATEEYDRIQSASGQKGIKAPKSDTGVALFVQGNGNGGRGGKSSPKPRLAKNGKPYGVCWNCGGKGHVSKDCPSPPSTSAGSSDKGKKRSDENRSHNGSANVAILSEEDGAWSTASLSDLFEDSSTDTDSVESLYDVSWDHIPTYLSDTSLSVSDGSMPDLMTVSESSATMSMPDLRSVSNSDSSSDDDWFSEVEDAASGDDSSVASVETSFEAVMANVCDGDIDEVAAILSEVVRPAGRVDLYDSGSTQHLSPYRDQFVTYQDIPPRSFSAANQQEFHAVGSGEMIIEVPLGADVSKMKLTEVLYSPEIGYTLISVGRLDEAGLTATFGNGQCELRNSEGEHIGSIPKSGKGLYRVIHESVDRSYADSANAATTNLTPMEFHRRMGHISPAIAKRLVTHGFVTGVSLDTSSPDGPIFCEYCTYAKTR
jgi:hypothetical protein